MLTFAAPAALNGRLLAEELRAAGIDVSDLDVSVVGDELHLAVEADRAAVERVVHAHVPPPPPVDPEDEFRAALEAATTVTQLRDALLGKAGPGAQARRPATR